MPSQGADAARHSSSTGPIPVSSHRPDHPGTGPASEPPTDPHGASTRRLLGRARAGDEPALDALLSRHQGRLLSWLRASAGAGSTARTAPDDVLQDTLLEAARKLDAFEDRGPASFYRWLVGIARLKLAEARRYERAARRAPGHGELQELDSALPGDVSSPSRHAQRAERGAALAAALAGLPERQGEAVRLRYLEGLSLEETAARLETSAAAVKALVSRGMAALARLPDLDG